MKHRLASQGPTGHLWPSFTILLLLSSFCYGEISGVPPSLSSFYLGILGGEAVSQTGMGQWWDHWWWGRVGWVCGGGAFITTYSSKRKVEEVAGK